MRLFILTAFYYDTALKFSLLLPVLNAGAEKIWPCRPPSSQGLYV
jgi:hypothetical protein